MNKLFIIIGSIATAILLGWFLSYPKVVKYYDLLNSIEQKKVLLADRENYVLRLQEASKSLEEHKDKLEKVKTALPDETSVSDLYDFFLRNVSEAGLIYSDMSVAGTGSKAASNVMFQETQLSPSNEVSSVSQNILKLQEIKITLNVSGKYENFKKLVDVIQNSARLFRIQNISISLEDRLGSGEPTFAFTLDLATSSY